MIKEGEANVTRVHVRVVASGQKRENVLDLSTKSKNSSCIEPI